MKSIISLFLIGFILTANSSLAEAPIKPKTTQETINLLITRYSTQYGVSASVMHKVIKCESSYKPTAVGDGGKSFGLVQIHLPSHPTITKAQAFDSEYAISFLAENLAKGKGRMWTCHRMYFS